MFLKKCSSEIDKGSWKRSTAVKKAGAYIVSIDKKAIVYRLKASKIVLLLWKNKYQAVHGNEFQSFTDPTCEFELMLSL